MQPFFLLLLAPFQAIKIKTVLSHFITFIWCRNNAKARPELTQNIKHGEGKKRCREREENDGRILVFRMGFSICLKIIQEFEAKLNKEVFFSLYQKMAFWI